MFILMSYILMLSEESYTIVLTVVMYLWELVLKHAGTIIFNTDGNNHTDSNKYANLHELWYSHQFTTRPMFSKFNEPTIFFMP